MARLLPILLLALFLAPGVNAEPRTVTVGGYEFAPYVEIDEAGKPSGLTVDLLDAMNAFQKEWRFVLVVTSPSRRYKDFAEGRYDMILFENPEWGWTGRDLPFDVTESFVMGGEVFIARAMPGRGQEWFASLKGRRIVGMRGYHYGFADFQTDPDILARDFGMVLVNSNQASIEMVLKGRADIAVVTDAYLRRYLARNPDARSRLLISQAMDQVYHHAALLRRGGRPGAADIQALLAAMEREGRLDPLWRAYGMKR
ncbi:MAG: transporter substrate-binding domain-containing protein [Alphaproteobacteria bacterium]|nr:transporter substrate-binding domain-containing protein [Alphaproteobacteria bacterium]